MTQDQPLHADRHRSAFNITLFLALAIAFFGILTADPILSVIGIAFAAWAWLTTPNSYALFGDRLVIAYGRPRLRTIPFNYVEDVELLRLAIGSPRVRVLQQSGKRTYLVPRDPETFRERFSEALERFRQQHPETEPPPSEQ